MKINLSFSISLLAEDVYNCGNMAEKTSSLTTNKSLYYKGKSFKITHNY